MPRSANGSIGWRSSAWRYASRASSWCICALRRSPDVANDSGLAAVPDCAPLFPWEEITMRPFNRRSALVIAATLLAAVMSHRAAAQDYPKKTSIRIIVPQAVGSATDTVARLLAQRLSTSLGQQMIVDNRPGAGGLLGGELASKAPPDGYTLILANISSHGVNPALYAKLPYDPIKDFTPIGRAGQTSNMLIVNSALPFKTLKELVEHAKANPGKLFYA